MTREETLKTAIKLLESLVSDDQEIRFELEADPGEVMNFNTTNLLREMGVPAHIRGYQYLRDAIVIVNTNGEMLHAVTGKLYPSIAEKYATTGSRVERGIRHAIGLAWEHGNRKLLSEIFTRSFNPGNKNYNKPTNSEFIATVAEWLKISKAA